MRVLWRFVARRVASGIVLLIAVTAVAYALIYSGGTNVAQNILGEFATEEQINEKAAELGTDRPLVVQYVEWLTRAVQGDFGDSWFTSQPVLATVLTRLSVTGSLVVVALTVAVVVSLVLGVAAARRRGSAGDRALQFVAVTGEAIPNFWLALALVSAFAISIPLFPATGYVSPGVSVTGWLFSLVLPVIAIVVGSVAGAAQQIRGAVIEVLQKDYVRTLRARGLSERSVVLKHALRNAASPALTVFSLQFIGMMSGAVLIERVFALPGMGNLAVDATLQGDIPIVMGVLITMAIVVVVVNLLVDIAAGWVNPKVRLQ
ncbi:ABC transporter permease [Arthrobacter sp. GMC3]|uniref:ABC transporter permease n=1 Tax=Arthrobacter sp. GMC3 TaxID=2058894 RepID=UPI0027959CCE|nr:ABC transporter permease [Arthrobacter sp. GMC3]